MTSEGFWLNLSNGRWLAVHDHAAEIKNFPRKFGLTIKDLAALNPFLPGDYDVLRLLAIQRGWVRIRTSTTGEVAAEFWSSELDDVMPILASLLNARGFGQLTWISLHDLKKWKDYSGTMQDLHDQGERLQVTGFGASCNRKVDAVCERAEELHGMPSSRQKASRSS